jgi:hypothetical protein
MGRQKSIYVQPKGENRWRKKRSNVWEMKQEHNQTRKAVERHIEIKGINEQINQDKIELKLTSVQIEIK